MNFNQTTLLILFSAGVFYFLIWYVIRKIRSNDTISRELKKAERIKEKARREAEKIKDEAEQKVEEKLQQTKVQLEKETQEKREELLEKEKEIIQREQNIERKVNLVDEKEEEADIRLRELKAREERIEERETELESIVDEQKRKLQRIAGMSSLQAKEQLKENIAGEARQGMVDYIQRIEAEAKQKAKEKVRDVISRSLNKMSPDPVIFNSVSIVEIPNEEMKGRIIGREGRNIRSFEMVTGVNVIVDNTPNMVMVSSFNPLRREIARSTLEKLVEDGRIHPAHIEEKVEIAREEIDDQMVEDGKNLVFSLGVKNLHPQLTKLIGKLKYKMRHGINLYEHTRELAKIAGGIAEELGIDDGLVKRAALLHDIGNACDSDEFEGSVVERAKEVLSNYGESREIIDIVEDVYSDAAEGRNEVGVLRSAHELVINRPGAVDEIFEKHFERLNEIEAIAGKFQGVERVYALRAGRELRVLVNSDTISDDEAVWLSKDIADRIESEMEYSGRVKVVVIRQSRAHRIAT